MSEVPLQEWAGSRINMVAADDEDTEVLFPFRGKDRQRERERERERDAVSFLER